MAPITHSMKMRPPTQTPLALRPPAILAGSLAVPDPRPCHTRNSQKPRPSSLLPQERSSRRNVPPHASPATRRCALRVPLGGRNAAVPRPSRAAPAGHRRRHRILLRLHDGLSVPPMRKGPCREAARPLSIGEPHPRERDGRRKASADFRHAHSTKCHWRLRVQHTPITRTLLLPRPASPARAHDVVRGRSSMSDEHPSCRDTRDRNHCEDVTHTTYASGPSNNPMRGYHR
jgi:hypothetical protein